MKGSETDMDEYFVIYEKYVEEEKENMTREEPIHKCYLDLIKYVLENS